MNAAAIKRALDEGDYLAAIGVDQDASRKVIEAAAARLQSEYVELAPAIGEAVQLLTSSEKREIYAIACQFRDDVVNELRSNFGSCIDDPRECVRKSAWSSIATLLRIEGGDAKIGPRGAASIARKGRLWVIEEILALQLYLECTEDELLLGRVKRQLEFRNCHKCALTRRVECSRCRGDGWILDAAALRQRFLVDSPAPTDAESQPVPRMACVACEGTGSVECDCEDTFVFDIPDGTKTGTALLGRGLRTKRGSIGIFGHPVYTERPSHALSHLYLSYNIARNDAGEGEGDFTLEAILGESSDDLLWDNNEARSASSLVLVCGALLGGISGGLVGLFLHRVLWAAAAGVVSQLPIVCLLAITTSHKFRALVIADNWGAKLRKYEAISKICFFCMVLAAGPAAAALLGFFRFTWKAGLLVGGMATAVSSTIIVFLYRRFQKAAR